MRNAEEFSARRSGLTRMLPTYRRPGTGAGIRPGSGRIRYAHGGALPRVEPFCAVPQGPAIHHGGDGDTGGVRDAAADGDTGGRDTGDGDTGGGAWLTESPVGNRHTDLWVLVGGGIAAAAAFAAAFVAAGGMASHPAAPGATVPAVVSQACPSRQPDPVGGRGPSSGGTSTGQAGPPMITQSCPHDHARRRAPRDQAERMAALAAWRAACQETAVAARAATVAASIAARSPETPLIDRPPRAGGPRPPPPLPGGWC